MYPIQIDQEEKTKDRLLYQFKDSPLLQKLLSIYSINGNKVETLLMDMLTEMNIYTAIGVQLDNIGALFGEPRDGQDDDSYRASIFESIVRGTSNGTPNVILSSIKTLTVADKTRIFEHQPACFNIYSDGINLPPNINSLVASLKPAGVNYFISLDKTSSGFTPAWVTSNEGGLLENPNATLGYIINPTTHQFENPTIRYFAWTIDEGFASHTKPKVLVSTLYPLKSSESFTSLTTSAGLVDSGENFEVFIVDSGVEVITVSGLLSFTLEEFLGVSANIENIDDIDNSQTDNMLPQTTIGTLSIFENNIIFDSLDTITSAESIDIVTPITNTDDEEELITQTSVESIRVDNNLVEDEMLQTTTIFSIDVV